MKICFFMICLRFNWFKTLPLMCYAEFRHAITSIVNFVGKLQYQIENSSVYSVHNTNLELLLNPNINLEHLLIHNYLGILGSSDLWPLNTTRKAIDCHQCASNQYRSGTNNFNFTSNFMLLKVNINCKGQAQVINMDKFKTLIKPFLKSSQNQEKQSTATNVLPGTADHVETTTSIQMITHCTRHMTLREMPTT